MIKLSMTPARAVLAAAAVVVVAISGWMLMGPPESTVQQKVALPTFDSTPSPADYSSLAEIADELEGDGLPCGELEYQEMDQPGQRTIREFATCYLFEDPSQNVELWLFDSEKKRDAWVDSFQLSTLVVVGPNWLATPQDRDRANAVMGSLGGHLVGRLPD